MAYLRRITMAKMKTRLPAGAIAATRPDGYSIDYPELSGMAVFRLHRENLMDYHREAIDTIVALFSEAARGFTGEEDWPRFRASVREGIIDTLTAAWCGRGDPVTYGLSDSMDPDNGVSITFPEAFTREDGIVIRDKGSRCLLFHDGTSWPADMEEIGELRAFIERHGSSHPGMTFVQKASNRRAKYPKYRAL